MLPSMPRWTRSLCSSVEATFCQNRPQPPQLLRGNITSHVYPRKNSGAGQTLHHQKAIKGKSRREAICSSQLPSWLISTVFLSHRSLSCVGSHPGDDPRHLSRGRNPYLALQLCWEKLLHLSRPRCPAASRSQGTYARGRCKFLVLGWIYQMPWARWRSSELSRGRFFPHTKGLALGLNRAQTLTWAGKGGSSTMQRPDQTTVTWPQWPAAYLAAQLSHVRPLRRGELVHTGTRKVGTERGEVLILISRAILSS